jgi:hypothetical protein
MPVKIIHGAAPKNWAPNDGAMMTAATEVIVTEYLPGADTSKPTAFE